MNTNFFIRQLGSNERDSYYSLRLRALEEHPQAFATSADEWRKASPDKIDALLLANERNLEPILGAFISNTEMVGSVSLIPETKEAVRHKASLAALYVAPEWRHKGIGMQLILETLQRARQLPELLFVRLVVDSENSNAIRLFEKAGFFVYGREPQARRVRDHYYDQSYMLCFLHNSHLPTH
jgi:ribosomal protein S18 acetylase RimI-like enzyme